MISLPLYITPTTEEYISQMGRAGEFEIRVWHNVSEEFGLEYGIKFHPGNSTRSILILYTTLSALHTESHLIHFNYRLS